MFMCLEEGAAYAADQSLTLASSLYLERAQTLRLSVMQVPDGCCLTKVCLLYFPTLSSCCGPRRFIRSVRLYGPRK